MINQKRVENQLNRLNQQKSLSFQKNLLKKNRYILILFLKKQDNCLNKSYNKNKNNKIWGLKSKRNLYKKNNKKKRKKNYLDSFR